MSIDSDRLHNLLCKTTNGPWAVVGEYADGEPLPDTSRMLRGAGGEHLGIMHTPDAELAALAPELARELLRLRRELTDLRDLMWKHSTYLKADGLRTAGDWTENHADRLARILEGDEA